MPTGDTQPTPPEPIASSAAQPVPALPPQDTASGKGAAKSPARLDHAHAQKRSGSEKRQRTAGIRVRLTPEERTTVEAAASRAGLTLASYTRGQMIGGVKPRAARRAPVETQQLAKILGELGKIGSNLNQLAKAANLGNFSVTDYEILRDETKGLVAARAALMEALGRSA